ncbi:MAG TPA: hypothetical protein PLB45_04730 [Bacilli bacterium]|jgi:hypothetical protein|nr:hypothetical protein [Bacilli bacterium]
MKKIFYLFTIMGIILVIALLTNTYALFETNGNATIDQQIGKWEIKLNGTDISKSITEDFVIDNFLYTDSSNVEDGYIAPGRKGYFDITINPTGTNVAVRYDIKISPDTTSYPSNITFQIEDRTNGTAVKTASDTYSGVIPLTSILKGETVTIRVNVNWENNTESDATDSSLGTKSGSSIEIPVNVIVSQYLGETITPYSS